ncbi:MAG: M67 family metallopeptidase [Anaerolineaceae bacterium]|nr:M67 family metallopeptidase [Anaerolineaceae bacterium]
MLERLVLPSAGLEQMRVHAARCAPEEACGLLAGKGERVETFFEVENELHSATRFRMQPAEQLEVFRWMDRQDLELTAIYHSHPSGPSQPSPTDIREFAYPGVCMLILSPGSGGWEARAYFVEGDGYTELPIMLSETE